MILYPENLEQKLEFDEIRKLLTDYCISELGEQKVREICFLSSKNEINRLLHETYEFKDIVNKVLQFPIQNYFNLSRLLKIISIENAVLETGEFLQIGQFLTTIGLLVKFLIKYKEDYPFLFDIIADLDERADLKTEIDRIIDEDAQVRNSASTNLADMRKKINKITLEMNHRFMQSLLLCRKNGWLHDEEQSVRQGELVLALQSKYKRQVKGLIMDESATGKTVFIQPEQVLELNYKLSEFRQAEKREIYRILKELVAFIRPAISELFTMQEILGQFDLIRSKAKLALKLNAGIPKFHDYPEIDLVNAYHPLLYLKNQEKKKRTIPLNLKLDTSQRILVISGPNAGGKSVCLKTTGLLQLMFQAGMLLPVHSNSSCGIFQQMFVDIGDNQSIDNDLSTYASKLESMKHFIDSSTLATLFLIDEFGSGTDPQLGGIIAESILEKLNEKKACGIVTTHYTNLKLFASTTKGLINGAMLFDMKTYTPTYQLECGKPGSSFAFELVKKIGFDDEFIELTESKLNSNEANLDSLLINLQNELQEVKSQAKQLQFKQNEADKIVNENTKLKQELADNKKKILVEAKEKAESYIENVSRQFDKLIKNWNDEKIPEIRIEKSKEIRKKIVAERNTIQTSIKKIRQKEVVVKKKVQDIKIGSFVILDDNLSIGKVENIEKGKAVVIFGTIRTKVEMNRLTVVEQKKDKKQSVHISLQDTGNQDSFSPILDVRGQRRDEAIFNTEKFVDQALVKNFRSLKIIHGYGDGILREGIRSTLKKYAFVSEIKSETSEFGGDGVTLIELD